MAKTSCRVLYPGGSDLGLVLIRDLADPLVLVPADAEHVQVGVIRPLLIHPLQDGLKGIPLAVVPHVRMDDLQSLGEPLNAPQVAT